MSNKPVCPICGSPTRVFMGNARKDRLCAKHADELKAGKIVMCEECGEWHATDEPCKCSVAEKYMELPTTGFDKCVICGAATVGYAFCRVCWKNYSNDDLLDILNGNAVPKDDLLDIFYESAVAKDEAEEEIIEYNEVEKEIVPKSLQPSNSTLNQADNKYIVINESNKSKCITCGKQTEGLLFCSACYHKYKNKELLFKITSCTNVELLDADYEGRYTCKDGHIVKSKSERDIDNYLFEKGISHAYEKDLPYGAMETETLHPDFYLPHYLGKDKHVYIEHWGYNENNIQYTKTKKFKMPIYKTLCDKKIITLICTYEKTDMGKIDTVLDRKLTKSYIKENEINFVE